MVRRTGEKRVLQIDEKDANEAINVILL